MPCPASTPPARLKRIAAFRYTTRGWLTNVRRPAAPPPLCARAVGGSPKDCYARTHGGHVLKEGVPIAEQGVGANDTVTICGRLRGGMQVCDVCVYVGGGGRLPPRPAVHGQTAALAARPLEPSHMRSLPGRAAPVMAQALARARGCMTAGPAPAWAARAVAARAETSAR